MKEIEDHQFGTSTLDSSKVTCAKPRGTAQKSVSVLMLNLIALIVAFITYGIFVIAALRCFSANRPVAKRNKLFVTLMGSITIVAILACIFKSGSEGSPQKIAGIIFILLGLGLFLASLAANRWRRMEYAGTDTPPLLLITVGPYAYLRHPIYASYSLGWLGGALCSMDPIAMVPSAAMAVFYVFAARNEEMAIMQSELFAAYRDYKTRVSMFIPYVI